MDGWTAQSPFAHVYPTGVWTQKGVSDDLVRMKQRIFDQEFEEIKESTYDVIIKLHSDVPWWFPEDGGDGEGLFDFEYVVANLMTKSLGFASYWEVRELDCEGGRILVFHSCLCSF